MNNLAEYVVEELANLVGGSLKLSLGYCKETTQGGNVAWRGEFWEKIKGCGFVAIARIRSSAKPFASLARQLRELG